MKAAMSTITVSWAEVTRDERGDVRGWHGWRNQEFSNVSDALVFAQGLRANKLSGVSVMDAERNRLD